MSTPDLLDEAAPRRRRPLLVAAGIGVVTLAAGTTAWLSWSDDPGDPGDDEELAAGVTSEPEVAWAVDVRSGARASARDDLVALVDDGTLTAWESDGTELWQVDTDASFVQVVEEHVVAFTPEDDFTVHDAGDGSALWTSPGSPLGARDGVLLALPTSDELAAHDLTTGEEAWRVDDVTWSDARADDVYVVSAGEVRRLDVASGEERWSVELDDAEAVDAVDGFVAVQHGRTVTALAAADGRELWTHTPDDADDRALVVVRPAGDGRVYVAEYGADEVDVLDAEGPVGTLATGPDGYFAATPFTARGEAYLLDAENRLYDADLRELGRYPGAIGLSADGLYTLDTGQLELYGFGDFPAEWSIDTTSGRTAGILVGDRVVYVLDNRRLTAYR